MRLARPTCLRDVGAGGAAGTVEGLARLAEAPGPDPSGRRVGNALPAGLGRRSLHDPIVGVASPVAYGVWGLTSGESLLPSSHCRVGPGIGPCLPVRWAGCLFNLTRVSSTVAPCQG